MAEKVSGAYAAASRGRCAQALDLLQGVIGRVAASSLTELQALNTIGIGLGCILHGASSSTGAETEALSSRTSIWWAAIPTIAKTHPRTLNAQPAQTLESLSEALGKRGNPGARRDFLAMLVAADYRPLDPFDRPDRLWLTYATMLADDGDASKVAPMLARLRDPGFIARAKLDKRFAAIVKADPAAFDVRAAAERLLAADQAGMMAYPRFAKGIVATANDLMLLGRPQEALSLTADALRRQRLSKHGEAIADWSVYGGGLVEAHASALEYTGDWDQWIAAMAASAKPPENGRPNVDQAINYALALLRLDHPDQALAVVAKFGADGEKNTSAFGRMVVREVEVCSHLRLGHSAEAAQELATLQRDRADNPDAVTAALTCVGDLDRLAANYIEQLKDPNRRGDALLDLSDFSDLTPLVKDLPYDAEMTARRDRVVRRADVKAAVSAVGHTETFDLQGGIL